MRQLYKFIFFAHNGPGPYECFFCHEEVTMETVLIHHVDHDHGNDDSKNLAPSHVGCHSRHHNVGRKRPDISVMSRTRKRTDAELENMRRAARTPEARAQKSRAGKAGAASRWGSTIVA